MKTMEISFEDYLECSYCQKWGVLGNPNALGFVIIYWIEQSDFGKIFACTTTNLVRWLPILIPIHC